MSIYLNGIVVAGGSCASVGGGHELFDIVQKDHILSYEETEGYELLGDYVYKTPVFGSKYGYPDFYNKVVEEYNASTSKHFKKYKSSNVTNTRLADKAGVLSGFTTSYYASNAFVSVSKMELVVKFTMGENNTTQQAIVGAETQYDGLTMYLISGKLTVYLSSNGTSWNVASKVAGSHLFIPYKTYLVKYKYIDTGYHKFYISEDDGETWIEDISISSSNLVFSGYHNLGIGDTKSHPFLGTIDLKGCYLIDISSNGMYNWQGCNYYEFDYVEHENGHKFYDIANKGAVDELFNSCGMAWFYGVDTANERVYLPRNVWFEQSTSDISEVGTGVDAGLPNIEGNAYHLMAASNNFTGPFKYTTDNANIKMGTNAAALGRNFDFDASLANPIYGNSDSVQPNAVKKLAYMVVGNVKTTEGYSEVVAQGKEILEQVNAGIADKALDDLSNVVTSNTKAIDGQWNVVPDYPSIHTAVAVGDYTLDISDYLPSDNYVYEVMFRFAAYTTGDSQKNVYLGTDIMPITSKPDAPVKILVDSSVLKYGRLNPSLVTQNRMIYLKITGAKLNECSVNLVAYRRLGTNQ